MTQPLRFEYIDAATLGNNPANWRRHSDGQLQALSAVIDDVGWAGALLYNETTGRLIDGHARKKIANGQPVPVLIGKWTEEQEKTILATLDPLAAMAEPDSEALEKLLAEVEADNEAVQAMLDELAAEAGIEWEGDGNGEVAEDGGGELDRADELREKWGTQTGQLWIIEGEQTHRLFCGDSTKAADVERVGSWDVAVIDPPFEMNSLPHLTDPSVVFGQAKHLRMIPDELWRFERVIDKGAMHRSATVNIGHRHAFVAQVGSHKVLPDRGETYDSIVRVDCRPDHPYEKPAWLLKQHLTLWMAPWSIVFDPFLGSGTTMVAAEQLGRRCYGIEIEPKYVAVILERMTGHGCTCHLTENK